jgi:RHS repeat-associated protein
MKSEKKMNQALTSRLYEYQYQFDAAGNRTQMKYFDGNANTITSYAHNNGNQLTLRSVGGAIYSYDYDANGNIVLRTNSSGGVLESLDKDDYGNVQVGSQLGYHLTTKEYDSIPELYYFWQRWYDPGLGRFIQKDHIIQSIIVPGSQNQHLDLIREYTNLYVYCLNNPINYFDLTGGCSSSSSSSNGGECPCPNSDNGNSGGATMVEVLQGHLSGKVGTGEI